MEYLSLVCDGECCTKGRHVDNLRPFDQDAVRNPLWAYGERAAWRTAEKLDEVISWTSETYPELTTDPRK